MTGEAQLEEVAKDDNESNEGAVIPRPQEEGSLGEEEEGKREAVVKGVRVRICCSSARPNPGSPLV